MKFWERIKHVFVANKLLKLASLLLAFALWFMVIIIDDPVSDKTFTNIQVNLVNTDLVTGNGMMYEVLESTDVLKRVSFDAPKSIRDIIQPSDIVAEADFENLTATNTVAITFACPKYSKDVTNISGNISNVKLNIENKKTKWVNIEYTVAGEVAEGYLIGGITLDQNRLEIVGPESKINMIEKATLEINVAGISSNSTSRYDVKLLSSDGEVVSYPSIHSNTDTVKVTVDVLATKEVPLEFMVMGVPAEGYLATGVVTGNPQTVLIAGTVKALQNINSIVIPAEEINVTGASENYEQMVDIEKYLPNGIVFGDPAFDGNANVVVYIEKIAEKTILLNTDMITLENIPEGMQAEVIPESGAVLRIRGLRQDLVELQESELRGTIDLAAVAEDYDEEELTAGAYTLKVAFALEEKYSLKDEIYVQVVLTAPEQEPSE